MTEMIDKLLKNSGLPGPRGNLELLYAFAKNASKSEVEECFSYYKDDLHNSPEEFVVMCGIVGSFLQSKDDVSGILKKMKRYASDKSWRIRESVAIGIQEIAADNMGEIIDNLKIWMDGNDLEKRAVVAALCEPKLLKEKSEIIEILEMLVKITQKFEKLKGRLSDDEDSLRKTLGYGWSVAIAALPEEGKVFFEKIAKNENKHVRWIVKENLKKKRLSAMDTKWVEKMLTGIIGTCSNHI
jgi:hypothetical protein